MTATLQRPRCAVCGSASGEIVPAVAAGYGRVWAHWACAKAANDEAREEGD